MPGTRIRTVTSVVLAALAAGCASTEPRSVEAPNAAPPAPVAETAPLCPFARRTDNEPLEPIPGTTRSAPVSRFDGWLLGDDDALTEDESRGYALFKSIGCAECHYGQRVGRTVTVDGKGVPSLRNVTLADRGPWFADKSSPTLVDAVRREAHARLRIAPSDHEIALLVRFLGALTGGPYGR